MTSMVTGSMLLFLGWIIVAQCRAGDLKITFTDVQAIVNGHFNNFDEVGDEVQGQDRVELYFKPTFAPGLQKDPVQYVEEIFNGKIYRRWIVVRNESSTDKILFFSYYNLTDSDQYKPWTFNTDDLINYKREQFQSCEDCLGAWEKMSEGPLIGTVVDPRHWINRKRPEYTISATCNDFRFTSPLVSDEKTSFLPYRLQHKGPRYPVPGVPEGYVNPCKDDQ